MKLSKYYSLKQAKGNEIISFTFPFIDAHSKIRREKRQLRNRLFAHERRLFLSKSAKKGQNMTILGFSCSLQSTFYTKNHCFTLKSLIFCPKTIATLVFETLNLSKLYL
jgi:hypothetical protein